MKYLLILFTCISFGQFNPIFSNSGRGQKNPSNTDIVAYYKLDGDGNDAVGLPNGIPTGVDYVSGKTGNAARFDSSNDAIDIVDVDKLSFTDGVTDLPFSVSMWVYFTDFNTVNYLINKRGGTSDVEWFITYVSSTSNLRLSKGSLGSNTDVQVASSPSSIFVLNTWYHIAITDNGTGTIAGIKMYINGVSKSITDSSSGTYVKMSNGTNLTRIGQNAYNISETTTNHKGYIEDVGIWKNKVISPAEINYLYNNGNGRTYPF